MPTQVQIAEHLDLAQKQVSEMVAKLGIDYRNASMDEVRIAYIRQLRAAASGHRSSNGDDLVAERVQTERVSRELMLLQLAEKRGRLVDVEQLAQAYSQMVGAFKTELLARDDKLKTELDALYGVNVDGELLNAHTRAALEQLSRYDAGGDGAADAAGEDAAAA